jgi:hypothetical protein
MRKSLRQAASALLAAAVLVALAAPAVAAPHEEPARAGSVRSPGVFAELLAWLGSWVDLTPVQSHHAPNGHALDPNGQPASPPPESGGAVTTEGGHAVDLNG